MTDLTQLFAIPLRDKYGFVIDHTIIDLDLADELGSLTWTRNGNGYAWRTRHRQTPAHDYLHRVVAGAVPGDGMYVDHINRDRLDNRRANLRLVTPAQSAQNKTAVKVAHRGVRWEARRRKWSAKAQLDGHLYNLGRFDSEDEAVAIVQEWRREHMPFSEEAGHRV